MFIVIADNFNNGRCKMNKVQKIISFFLLANICLINISCTNNDAEKKVMANKVMKKNVNSNGTIGGNLDTVTLEKEEEKLDKLLAKAKAYKNYSYEVVSIKEGKEVSTKFWRKDNKYRLNIDADSNVSIFKDKDKNEEFMYDRNYNIITNVNGSGKINVDDYQVNLEKLDLFTCVRKADEIVDNKNCSVYEFDIGEQKEYIYLWKEFGIVIKIGIHEKNKEYSEILFKNYQIGNVTDEVINIPKDAVYVDWQP